MKKFIEIVQSILIASETVIKSFQEGKTSKVYIEQKMQHLEFVQNVITRMNTNSFQIKGFVITIVAAVFSVYIVKPITEIILISIFTTAILWLLDTYYLWQERKFRGLYNDIVDNKIDLYKMPMNKYVYDKNDKKTKKYSYWSVVYTIKLFYLPIIILLSLILWIIKIK